MNNLYNDINEVKKIIEYSLKYKVSPLYSKPFAKYSRAYYCTNENINAYLKLDNHHHIENALSVLASGDQTFSLITKGIFNIDTFDINKIAYYYALGLKRAMIIKYNYDEYILINDKLSQLTINIDELNSIITELIPYMELDCQIFWKELMEYNYKINKGPINFIYLITQNNNGFKKSIKGVNFLKDKENYNILRKNIIKANIIYRNEDLMNITYQKEYDLILLSNILSYYEREYYKDFNTENLFKIIKYLEKILKDSGTIYLNYFFENETLKATDEIWHLKQLKLEFFLIDSISYLYDNDGLLLKRGK